MPRIDIDRLRRFHGEAKAASAALREVYKRLDDIRYEISRQQKHLAELRNPESGYRSGDRDNVAGSSRPGVADHEKIAEKAIKEAQAAYTLADAEHDRLTDIQEHAQSMWRLCREYADFHNALPDDLRN